MKKNISVEQLSILNFNQQKKIATMFEQYENCVRNDKNGNEYFNLDVLAKRINIGKMIEILLNNIPQTNCIEDSLNIECDRVTKTSYVEYRESNFEFIEFKDKELCDALWESVKSIL